MCNNVSTLKPFAWFNGNLSPYLFLFAIRTIFDFLYAAQFMVFINQVCQFASSFTFPDIQYIFKQMQKVFMENVIISQCFKSYFKLKM